MLACGKLYSCAVFVSRGRILGVVPKTHVPGYAEFYEPRMFAGYTGENIVLPEWDCPFGTKLL